MGIFRPVSTESVEQRGGTGAAWAAVISQTGMMILRLPSPAPALPSPPLALTEYTAPEGLAPKCPNSFFLFLILRLEPKPHEGQA